MLQIFLVAFCVVCSLDASIVTVENRIELAAKETGTDEIVILRNGHTIYRYRSPKAPQSYDIKEMTGMFLSFAIGSLIDQKKIPCLDIPVTNYLSDYHCRTTLQQLLNHTSGFSKQYDFQILSKVIAAVTKKTTQEYIGETFFVPMGIKDYSWVSVDGNETLMLQAEDLAKVGWMVAKGGQWQCKPLLSPQWIETLKLPSQTRNPFFGQQLWLEYRDFAVYWDEALLNHYWKAGMSQSFLCKLAELDNREIHLGGSVVQGNILRLWGRELSPNQYRLVELLSETYFKDQPFGHFTPGPIKALIGWGAHGQQLVIMPEEKIVGVRLTAHSTNPFIDFTYELDALSKEYTEPTENTRD